MLAEPLRLALRVGREFDALAVPWVVGGSVASSLHGLPRSTQAIDLVAALRRIHAGPLSRALAEEFYVDREAIIEACVRQASFNLVHFESATKIDVFLPRGDRLSAAQLLRRQPWALTATGGEVLPVLSPEDVILQKLRWYASGGGVSERQWRDVIGVLSTRRGALDLEYLSGQAAEARLAELLARAIAEVAP